MNPDLSQLRDIHLPAPISWWPPAIGWWLLLVLLVVLIVTGFWIFHSYRLRKQRQQWHRDALAELKQLQQQQLSTNEQVMALSILLRRVAITRFPREEVASLTGEKWLAFLDQQMSEAAFQSRGRLLATAPYSANVDADLTELCALCERWINGVAR